MNRREMLKMSGAAMLGLGLSPLSWAMAEKRPPKRRILVFTKSSGYEHAVIKRQGDKLSLVEQTLTDLGTKHNFEVTCTKDGSLFTPENIGKYDAFFFYTTGDLTTAGNDKNPPMSAEGKAAFLEAIKNGKGFVGSHAATDTFHTPPDTPDRANRYILHGEKADPYIRMVGADFIIHGKQQVAKMRVVDDKFPGFDGVKDFELMEEWYSLIDFSPNLHVLMVQETQGMAGPMYQRPPYPATWARMHGKGRVFYTSMGHREDVWANPMFLKILLGGLMWSVGNVDADVTSNVESVTPGYNTVPPKA